MPEQCAVNPETHQLMDASGILFTTLRVVLFLLLILWVVMVPVSNNLQASMIT
ncbi:hypothetical protein BDQ17DRAFT_1423303 [Cyathus striatus]|nr:hypothetical protein BDQ17DRAFT_1439404 [Cyathus striatus]KAF9006416.1 hypothetical protein BDQ17DRAFT_1423303 [Cyathus striatus]